jgi:hypothetical protein
VGKGVTLITARLHITEVFDHLQLCKCYVIYYYLMGVLTPNKIFY